MHVVDEPAAPARAHDVDGRDHVAALALQLDAKLKTTNLKHFPMFTDLKAPY